MQLYKPVRTFTASSPPAFRSSMGIPSHHAAFRFDMCLRASYNSISFTSGSSSYIFSLKESVAFGSLLTSSSGYCSHISFTSFPPVTTFPVLSIMAPHLELYVPVISLISLYRSLVFRILLLSLICRHFSFMLCSLSCLALLWKTAFSILYSLSSPLLRTSLRSPAIFVR